MRAGSGAEGAGDDAAAAAAATAAAAADAAAAPPPPAAGAAAATAATAQQQQQLQQLDPSLVPFAARIGDRRFTCTMCGKCCTGSGNVWVSAAEAERIAAHLNIGVRRFLVSGGAAAPSLHPIVCASLTRQSGWRAAAYGGRLIRRGQRAKAQTKPPRLRCQTETADLRSASRSPTAACPAGASCATTPALATRATASSSSPITRARSTQSGRCSARRTVSERGF